MSDQSTDAHGPIVEPHDSNLGYPPESHGEHMGHDAHAGGIAKYIYVFIALCFVDHVVVFDVFELVAGEFYAGGKPDVDDGCFVHEVAAGDFVLHAHLVGSELEIRVDDSSDADVDIFDADARAGRRPAVAACLRGTEIFDGRTTS